MNRCPCAQPDWPGSPAVYGAAGGTAEAPKVEYFGAEIPVTANLLESWAKSPLGESEVLRFSADCKGADCRHWDERSIGCSVPGRFIAAMAADADALPYCGFRPQCEWYRSARAERGIDGGIAMCRRCRLFPTDSVTAPPGDPYAIVDDQPVYL
jgi:hypothetical protein